jgi:hypothetical protein
LERLKTRSGNSHLTTKAQRHKAGYTIPGNAVTSIFPIIISRKQVKGCGERALGVCLILFVPLCAFASLWLIILRNIASLSR